MNISKTVNVFNAEAWEKLKKTMENPKSKVARRRVDYEMQRREDVKQRNESLYQNGAEWHHTRTFIKGRANLGKQKNTNVRGGRPSIPGLTLKKDQATGRVYAG